MKPPDPEAVAGRLLDARLHLLDRQVIDVHGEPVTAVDDVELSEMSLDENLPPDAPAPVIVALLSGPVPGRPDLRWPAAGIAVDQDPVVGGLRDRGGHQAGGGR